jgi:maleylpyruvate isomerase
MPGTPGGSLAWRPADPLMTSEEVLQDLRAATAQLSSALTGLSDESARGASLLPGWTRGHVLAHLAQNAEGGTRLLTWARTGMPSYQYESLEARASGIDAAAGLPAAVLAGDFRRTAAAFADSAAGMPPQAWRRTVRYADGEEPQAAVIVPGRLAEVLIHHVDLGIGYQPSDWPASFVGDLLARIARSSDSVAGWPGSAPDHEVLAWRLGRPGNALAQEAEGPPPPPLPPFVVLYG